MADAYPQVREFFPEADRFGSFEGTPPAAPVFKGAQLLGYAFVTHDILRIPAYSGKPINTLVGLDLRGEIVGLAVVHHEEPILAVGITPERLNQFVAQYKGRSALDRITIGARREGYVALDGISGATITVMVENATVMRSARQVAESRSIPPMELPPAKRDVPAGASESAPSADQARAAVASGPGARPSAVPEARDGPAEASSSFAETTPMTAGSSSPRKRAAKIAEKVPGEAHDMRAMARAEIPASSQQQLTPGIDAEPAASPAPSRDGSSPGPAEPAPVPTVAQSISAALAAPPGEEPIWVAVWRGRTFEIALLIVGLAVLSFILVFQDWLARHPTLLTRVRNAFHLYTAFFLGWYALAQLSVVNVLTFSHSLFREFRWENFLVDPMLFILWSFVAVTLLLWGRGVYCGWLCPFGALQELTLEMSRRLKLPQYEFPDVVHERLWAVKYIVLILLFGVSLQSLAEAAQYAEIEPFKTAITLRFQREWPFVLYAIVLIAISFFNRKFFCKYLCPLGAALSIPGRFRLFDWWLRRRKECGKPCQVCSNRCSVRAVRPTGEINANECHYCLDCQVIYYNDKVCLPLIERRKKREARAQRGKQSAPDRVIPMRAVESIEGPPQAQ